MEYFEDFKKKFGSWIEPIKSHNPLIKLGAIIVITLYVLSWLPVVDKVSSLLKPDTPAVKEPLPGKFTPEQMPEISPLATPAGPHFDSAGKLGTCATVLRASSDYNFDDGTHQREAWTLFEQALLHLSIDERKIVDMHRVEEARRDWQSGLAQKALTKFSSAFACDPASKPNLTLQRTH